MVNPYCTSLDCRLEKDKQDVLKEMEEKNNALARELKEFNVRKILTIDYCVMRMYRWHL